MPRIHNQFLECSIYLYPSKVTAERGEGAGGSGCLVSIASPIEGYSHAYAVTNSHVIHETNSPVIRLNTTKGEKYVLELEQDDWIHHPAGDDIAVCPIDFPAEQFSIRFIDRDKYFITPSRINFFDIGIGESTFMVGRLINHEGEQRNIPSVRFGNIAMMPHEPVESPRGHLQECFLVESKSIAGFSGSPVFVHIPNYEIHFKGYPRGVVLLLGINNGHIQASEKVVDSDGDPHPEGWEVNSNTGMATVIPAWRLDDLLNIPKLVDQRKKEDEELLKKAKETLINSDTLDAIDSDPE